MKQYRISIHFESRREVTSIVNALDEFLIWGDKEDFNEDEIDDIRNLKNMLGIMEANWKGGARQ